MEITAKVSQNNSNRKKCGVIFFTKISYGMSRNTGKGVRDWRKDIAARCMIVDEWTDVPVRGMGVSDRGEWLAAMNDRCGDAAKKHPGIFVIISGIHYLCVPKEKVLILFMDLGVPVSGSGR